MLRTLCADHVTVGGGAVARQPHFGGSGMSTFMKDILQRRRPTKDAMSGIKLCFVLFNVQLRR